MQKFSLNSKWGFIDSLGSLSIECQYDEAKNFNKGLAVVIKDSNRVLINKKGQQVEVLEDNNFNYYDLGYSLFEGGAQLILIDTFGNALTILNKNTKIKFDEIQSLRHLFEREKHGRIGYINKNGKLINDSPFYIVSAFEDDYAIVASQMYSDELSDS